ncbi:STM4013/SEN3800 family hydrolase [Flavobacterium oreochromis]|uniref:STM4013/SEN3800 family hydrolase n=1 Tax=Flavobacterium oreochromis TaxID=2906078 RepID=UPI003858203A
MLPYNMNDIAGKMNFLFITLDSLRYDVAQELYNANEIPNLAKFLPNGWDKAHSPGSFTFAAHQAFFAGFLPTPAKPGKYPRLFAANFAGSETTSSQTLVFDTPDILTGFENLDYQTVCIGGVGFFNKKTALGTVLPNLFQESYWEENYGVTEKNSTYYQIKKAVNIIQNATKNFFLFINFSAIHQPNWFYDPNNHNQQDNLKSHAAALRYIDSQLPELFLALEEKGDTFCIICSDHGTAYGEEGYVGHRISHPTVWEVPMTTFILNKKI